MKKSKTVSECKSEMLAIKAEIAKYNKLVSNEEDNFLNASSKETPQDPDVSFNGIHTAKKLFEYSRTLRELNEKLDEVELEYISAYADHAHELLADKQEEIDNIQSDLDKANKANSQHGKYSYDRECRYKAAMEVVETAVHAVDRLDNWMHDEDHFSSLSDAADATRCIYNTLVHCLNDKDLRYQMPCYIPTSRNVDIVTNED